MNFDFPTILVLATIFTGVVSLVDLIYCRITTKKWQFRETEEEKKPILIDYSRSFFPVLLIVLLFRSFVAQPYRVPTGSLEPTVMPGDFLFVTQYNYGLRLPAWGNKIIPVGEPQKGQIALFYWPVNPRLTFVKRVIGVPGDHISYVNKVLFVNGKEAKRRLIGHATDRNDPNGPSWPVDIYEEDLNGIKHKIYICSPNAADCPNQESHDFYNLVVPQGKYFMMGDNRDDSDDSRDWGFVPDSALIGRARIIWMNWDPFAENWYQKINFNRIGHKL